MSDSMHGQDEQALSAAREVLRTDPEARPSAALEARLRAGFREVHAARRDRAAQEPRRWWQRPLARAAAVLLAACAAGWGAWTGVRGPSTISSPANAERPRAIAVAGTSQPRAGVPQAGRATPPPSTSAEAPPLAATTMPIAQAIASEPPALAAGEGLEAIEDDVEDFHPLAWLPDDHAGPEHLIEVDVPASAVLDFGLASAAAGDDEATVRAAVLVGEDGRPRAIQFLERAPSARPVGTSPTQSLERRRMQP